MAFSCSCRTSPKLIAVPGQLGGRGPYPWEGRCFFQDIDVASQLLVLGFKLADALVLRCQWFADARLTELFSIDLRQPASHRTLSELHVPADLHNAQAPPPDHLNYLQLEAGVKHFSF